MISAGYAKSLYRLLLLGGLVLVAINGWTTWEQGAKWAVTENGKLIIAITIVAIEVIGVVIVGFAGGSALGARKWTMGILLTFMMLASAVVVVNSIGSFQATERISSTETQKLNAARLKDADQMQAKSADKAMALAGRADGSRARGDFIKANQQSIADFRNVKTDVVIEVDAGAKLWSYLFGLSLQQVQMGQAGYTAILQIALSMVCIHAAGFFRSWSMRIKAADEEAKTAEPSSKDGSKNGSGGSEPSSGESEPKLRIVHPVSEPSSVALRALEAEPSRLNGSDNPLPEQRNFVPARESLVQRLEQHGSTASLNHLEPSAEPSSPEIEGWDPAKVSTGGKRVNADGPKRKRKAKVPFDQMRRSVKACLVHGEPTKSSHEIAAETGWSQSHVLRQFKREMGIAERRQQHLPLRRDPRGRGASLHH